MTNEKLLSDFKDVLKKEGLKVTPQRISVLEEIIKDKGLRESEEIYMAIKLGHTISSTLSGADGYEDKELTIPAEYKATTFIAFDSVKKKYDPIERLHSLYQKVDSFKWLKNGWFFKKQTCCLA